MSDHPKRILVLTSLTSAYAPLMLDELLRIFGDDIVAVVTSRARRPKSQRFTSVARRAGARYALLKALLFGSIFVRQLLGAYPTVSALCKKYRVDAIQCTDSATGDIHRLVKELHPSILVSVLFEELLPESIISTPGMTCLNLHPSPLPRYAGIAPTFWGLSEGEKKWGVTIHVLSGMIDGGDIARQEEVPIISRDTVHSLYVRCCRIAGKLLDTCVSMAMKGELRPTAQNLTERTYYRSPDRAAYRRLRQNGHRLYTLHDLLRPLREWTNG